MNFYQFLKLSIIIPIKISLQNKFLIRRLNRLVDFFHIYKNIEIIVVDSSNFIFSKKISKIKNIRYYYLNIDGIYSASKARNYGAKFAKGEYILFYDVDLVVKKNFIDLVFQDINELELKAKEAFTIYPCLYLSEAKTKEIEKKGLNDKIFDEIKMHYLEGFNDEVLYLAVNTSTILVNKDHFFNIGGYNEVFKGHGYEDFELIHRLYLAYPIVKRELDYATDFKTPFPYYYKGFRKYFAYYALPNFFKGRYTLHLWHPRPLTKKYYRHREVNFKYFLKYLENSLKQPIKAPVKDYYKFIDNLMIEYKLDNEKYCGLKELNHIAKTYKAKFSLKRKIRRKFLNLLDKISTEKKGINNKI